MSSTSWNNAAGNTPEENTIAGYFASQEDAHRAITELMKEGIKTKEIGAAFHSGASRPSSSRSAEQAANDTPLRSATRLDASVAGPASGTGAVTPMGLSTGGGTIIAGAGAPGPIPGSEIPSNLPTNIPSELPSNFDKRGSSRAPSTDAAMSTAPASNFPATGGFHETQQDENWWDKLKHIFGAEDSGVAARREPVADKTSLNYGTGQGHLGTYPDYDYAYSGSAFESSFSGMGIPQEKARHLAHELGRGGAVITVKAGQNNAAVETILERNHGIIRYESGPAAGVEDEGNRDARVQIFGEVHRVYPGYVPGEDVRERKAS